MTESVLEMCESSKGCVKCILVVINSMLLIAGAATMATGIWMLTAESSLFYRYHDVIADSDVNASLLKNGVIAMLAGGLGILMFASIGIVAAVTSSTGLLAMYAVLLAMLMTVEVVPIILAVVYRADWVTAIDREVVKAFGDKYGDVYTESSREFTSAFDALQSDFDCCGWWNGSDYEVPAKGNETSGSKKKMARSCCSAHNDTTRDACLEGFTKSQFYNTTGCRKAFTNLLTTYEHVLISLGAVVLGLELLTEIGTVTLLSISVGNKYDLS